MIPEECNVWGTGIFTPNLLLKALMGHLRNLIQNYPDLISSPIETEDQVSEWLGQHAGRYPRCRAAAVVVLIRPYEGRPAARIYYEATQGIDLHPVMLITFS
jgi:hypothetical protein